MLAGRRIVLAFALAVTCALSTLCAEVTIQRDGDALKKLTLTTGKGKGALVMVPAGWQNTTAITASGKRWPLIDPFMYQLNRYDTVAGKTVRYGGYMNAPKVFHTWEAKQIKDPNRPDAEILWFAVEPKDLYVKKDVTVTVDKGHNVAYVLNRITAVRDAKRVSDDEYYYFKKPGECEIWIDGKQLDIAAKAAAKGGGKTWSIFQYFCQYNPKANVTYAIVFLGRKAQRFPGSSKPTVRLGFYNVVKNGGHVYWRTGGNLKVGQQQWLQYALVWGDGNLKDQVAELAKQAQAGKLEAKVHRPKAE